MYSIIIKELNFYLHKTLNINEIKCKEMEYFQHSSKEVEWNRFVPETRQIKIILNKSLRKGEHIEIKFKYSGVLKLHEEIKVNNIDERWVELSSHSGWHPLYEKLDKSVFKVELNLGRDYEVCGYPYAKPYGDKWILSSDSMAADCVIVASKELKVIGDTAVDNGVRVYYVGSEYEDAAQKIYQSIKLILNKIEYIICPITNINLAFIIAPRTEGGGYCRPELIVISNKLINSNFKQLKFITHELSHIWWSQASWSTWEDWLNESFAEYTTLMVIREVYGEEEFDKLIQDYNAESKGLPPIYGINRNHEMANPVLYKKGPIILHQLEQMLGEDKFKQFLRNVYQNKISSTNELVNELTAIASDVVVNKFIDSLKE
ncbi:MAG: hypothetical protein K0R84_672 [Clostridia bacterium]|jgi:hypothetical protein|nr:hypothetical protein [Clostridia bacterium]